jgi:H+/Cl- antiporter ClcA
MVTTTDPRHLLGAYEPSTDFPTLEDEAPCPGGRRWGLVALAAAVGLALGLLVGWWLGREGALAIAGLD